MYINVVEMHHHHVLSLSLSLAQGYTDLHAFLCRSNLRLFILLWIPAPSSSIGLPFILFQPPRGPNEKLKRSKKVYIYIYIYPEYGNKGSTISNLRIYILMFFSDPCFYPRGREDSIDSIFEENFKHRKRVNRSIDGRVTREAIFFDFLLILVHRQFDFNIPRAKSQRYSRDLGEIKCVIN